MLDMSNSGFPDWRQTPPLPSNGSPDVGGTSQSHHQPQADIDEAYAEALEQTQIPKRARGGPSPQIPTAKRTLSSTARGADGQANGGSNAHRMSLLDDDMLLSILGWEMADDAEDGSAHGSFAVAAAMQRASSSAAQDMSGGVSLDPSGLASMARTGFDIGADDSVTGGYHAAAALTATAQQLPFQRLGTLESTVGRPAAGLETGLAGGDETAIRGRNQFQQQQQQQPPLQPPLQQSRQQLLLQQHHHMRYANEQESQTNTQHQMQIPPQQEQQQQQLQLSNSQELQPSGTLAPSEVLASVGTGWPSRSGGIMLPSPAPAIAVSSFSQSPWVLPLPSPPVQGGGTAGAPMQGLMPPTGAYDEDDIREDEGVDPKGDDVASRALQDDEDMPEGLLSEAASALLETSDRSGRWNVVNGKPGSFGPWRLSSEHVSSAQTEAKKQWQQLEERSRRLDAVVREKEQLQAALLQSKARLQEAQRLLRCKLCRIGRRNCVVLPCMHFSYCHGCIAAHCATDAHCPACASPVSGFQTLLLID